MDMNFASLPPHVIANILSHLRLADFKNAVLVCTSWYNGSCCMTCGRNITVTLTDDYSRIAQFTDEVHRPFHRLRLQSIDFNVFDYKRILSKLQFSVEKLSISRCLLSCDQLFESLNILEHLKVLKLVFQYNQMPAIQLDGWLNQSVELKLLTGMKKMIVKCFQVQIDGVNKMLGKCKNLDYLQYCSDECLNTSRDQMFQGIAQWNCIDMKYLNINFNSETNWYMKQMQTLNIIRLDKLMFPFNGSPRYDDVEFHKFCQHFNCLKEIKIRSVTNNGLLSITENLKNLKKLSIFFKGDQLYRIAGLFNLEVLRLGIFPQCKANLIIQQLFSVDLPKLTDLTLEDVQISKENLILLCDKFKSLSHLQVGLSTSDCSPIFKNLLQLKSLQLYVCDMDSASSESSTNEELTILNLQKLKKLKINKYVPGITEELLRLLPNCDTIVKGYRNTNSR